MLDYSQLEALLAVEETGTFEGAARELNLSSFAVIQRIKTLEGKLGVVLIERGPTRTTDVGKILCAHTREICALEERVVEQHRIDSLAASNGSPTLSIAVSDENIADWFVPILEPSAIATHIPHIDVQLFNQSEALNLMRSGHVVAALNHQSQIVYGFKSLKIGSVSYRAVASPAYMSEHFSESVSEDALSKAPSLRYCGNDTRAQNWVEQIFGKPINLLIYRHPSNDGALKACLEGKVWTVLIESAVKEHIECGRLVELIPNTPVSREIYWHVAGNMIETVRPITRGLREQASIV